MIELNEKHRSILEALREKSMYRIDLSPLVGWYGTEMTLLLKQLRNLDLICNESGHRPMLVITTYGLQALNAHTKKVDDGPVAQPNRINLFSLPTYSTPESGYQRNFGNKHVPSRGW